MKLPMKANPGDKITLLPGAKPDAMVGAVGTVTAANYIGVSARFTKVLDRLPDAFRKYADGNGGIVLFVNNAFFEVTNG